MVVTAFTVERFELALARPLRSAAGDIDRRRGFLVRYGTGVGEATPLPPWTEPYETTADHLDTIAADDPPPSRALAQLEQAPAARHAVALALADHHARTAGVSLATHLGDTTLDRLPVNAVIDDATPTAAATAAADAVDAGYPAVKLKVGHGPLSDDLDRVGAVRDAIGPATELRLDANAAWDADTAVEAAAALGPAEIHFVEQPIPGFDPEVIRSLVSRGLPVAIDEALPTTGIAAVCRSDATAVVVKPMALGGPDRARAVAVTARTCGITPVLSDLVTGAVGRLAVAHIACSLGNPVPAGLDTGRRLSDDLISDPPRIDDGHLRLPAGPGLGIEVPTDG